MMKLMLPLLIFSIVQMPFVLAAETITKESPTEIKVSRTVDQVVSLASLQEVKARLEEQKARLEAEINRINGYISEAQNLGVK